MRRLVWWSQVEFSKDLRVMKSKNLAGPLGLDEAVIELLSASRRLKKGVSPQLKLIIL